MSTELSTNVLSDTGKMLVALNDMTPEVRASLVHYDPAYTEFVEVFAKKYQKAGIVPKDLQAPEKLPDVQLLVMSAMLHNIPPIEFLRKSFVVGGKVGMEAELIISIVNRSKRFGVIKTEREEGEIVKVPYTVIDNGKSTTEHYEGPNTRVRAFALHRESNEVLYGPWISMELAVKAGWYGKNGSQWKTDPDNMLDKRAMHRFCKKYAADVLAGLASVDDLIDEKIDDQGDAKEVSKTPSLDKVVNNSGSTVKKTTLPAEVLADVKASDIEEATVVAETVVEAEETPEEVDTETGEEFAVFFELPPFDTVSKEFKPANLSELETVKSMTTYAVLEHVKMLFASGCATERQYNSALALMEKVRGAQSETEQLEKLVQLYEWGFNNIYSKRLELYNA